MVYNQQFLLRFYWTFGIDYNNRLLFSIVLYLKPDSFKKTMIMFSSFLHAFMLTIVECAATSMNAMAGHEFTFIFIWNKCISPVFHRGIVWNTQLRRCGTMSNYTHNLLWEYSRHLSCPAFSKIMVHLIYLIDFAVRKNIHSNKLNCSVSPLSLN